MLEVGESNADNTDSDDADKEEESGGMTNTIQHFSQTTNHTKPVSPTNPRMHQFPKLVFLSELTKKIRESVEYFSLYYVSVESVFVYVDERTNVWSVDRFALVWDECAFLINEWRNISFKRNTSWIFYSTVPTFPPSKSKPLSSTVTSNIEECCVTFYFLIQKVLHVHVTFSQRHNFEVFLEISFLNILQMR